MGRLDVTTLTGQHVILEPLRRAHVSDIAAAASGDRSSFGLTPVPDGHAEAAAFVDVRCAAAAKGTEAPFVQRRIGRWDAATPTRSRWAAPG